MKAIHRSRQFGRLLAVWLLLWFVAMGAAPVAPLSALGGLQSAASISGDQGDVADCGVAQHPHHHDHAAGEAAPSPDACTATARDVHAGHGAGSLSHCPLCLHGAAPPPALIAALLATDAPDGPPVAASTSVRRTRTDVPPPARGPPAHS